MSIESTVVTLRDTRPVLNGVPLVDSRAEVLRDDAEGITLRYTAPVLGDGVLGVELNRVHPGCCRLRCWFENLDEGVILDSFGLRFETVENLRAYLRNGYHSWDGSDYVEPERTADHEPDETQSGTGYAMTQLLPRFGEGSVVLGFDRHDRFQHTFTFGTRQHPIALTALTLWDRKERTNLARCESEWLVIFEHAGVEEALREWARWVAEASPDRPRVSGPPIIGWCSWYNLYAYITEENILEHLHGVAEVARRENLPIRVFQIDDGFTPEMGDWLEVKPQFPRGMKPLLDDIRAAGFVPGLWIAPFLVGNRSRLYRDHPDWVVKDQASGGPLVQWKLYAEFRWHKRSEEYYILDATHPEAFDYLRHVFRTWRQEWGCEYFKTDFMHFGSEHGPDRAAWHKPGMTRIEIWRRVAKMIRDEIGEATWLGCGCPLWAAVGLVDAIRIGRDAGVEWRGSPSAQSLLRDQATRNFANHILWQIDPDCILLRDRFHHLTDAEMRSLALYAGMSGGVMMTSDALHELSCDQLRLWRLLLSPRRGACRFPFLGRADPVLVQVRTSTSIPSSVSQERSDEAGVGAAAVFIFNTGEYSVQRTYPLESLGLKGSHYVFDWIARDFWSKPVEHLSVRIPPHDSILFFLSPRRMTTMPQVL